MAESPTHQPPNPQPPPDPPPVAPPVVAGPGVPRCPVCGYEISGIAVDGVCPECGNTVWQMVHQPPTSGYAIASLVLGCVTILTCAMLGPLALLTGGPAVICGEIAARQITRGERGGASKGLALAGRILGWFGVVMGVIGIGVMVFMYANP